MALDGTAAGLRASIADFLNRADLSAAIPDFIALAEAQINRRLRVRRMVATSTATISLEYEEVPSDFAGAITVTLSDGRQLDFLSPDGLAQKKWLAGSPSGEPEKYTVVGGQFQFLPAPDADYTAFLTYFQALPALSSNSTNWLLTVAPDVYLYGALTQAAPYLKDDERVQVWGQLFITGLTDLQNADRRESAAARLEPRPPLVI